MIKLKLVDDLDKVTDAAETVTIGLNGEWRELDLSEANAQQIRDDIQRYWDAGREPDGPVLRRDRRPGKPRYGQQFYKGFRKWADEHGIKYETPGGNSYYRDNDIKAYLEYLKEHQGQE